MRTFCIIVSENRERTVAAHQHFAERGVAADFVDGINGPAFGLRTEHEYVFGPERDMIAPAQVGLCLSHLMVWTMCLHSNEPGPFLILEDDADFPSDWQDKLDEALACTPHDADMLYLGSCCCADKPQTHVRGPVFEVKWPLCTHAILVWKKALPTLLRTQRDVWAKIDLSLYHRTLDKLRVYTVLPSLVGQRGTPLHP